MHTSRFDFVFDERYASSVVRCAAKRFRFCERAFCTVHGSAGGFHMASVMRRNGSTVRMTILRALYCGKRSCCSSSCAVLYAARTAGNNVHGIKERFRLIVFFNKILPHAFAFHVAFGERDVFFSYEMRLQCARKPHSSFKAPRKEEDARRISVETMKGT